MRTAVRTTRVLVPARTVTSYLYALKRVAYLVVYYRLPYVPYRTVRTRNKCEAVRGRKQKAGTAGRELIWDEEERSTINDQRWWLIWLIDRDAVIHPYYHYRPRVPSSCCLLMVQVRVIVRVLLLHELYNSHQSTAFNGSLQLYPTVLRTKLFWRMVGVSADREWNASTMRSLYECFIAS